MYHDSDIYYRLVRSPFSLKFYFPVQNNIGDGLNSIRCKQAPLQVLFWIVFHVTSRPFTSSIISDIIRLDYHFLFTIKMCSLSINTVEFFWNNTFVFPLNSMKFNSSNQLPPVKACSHDTIPTAIYLLRQMSCMGLNDSVHMVQLRQWNQILFSPISCKNKKAVASRKKSYRVNVA